MSLIPYLPYDFDLFSSPFENMSSCSGIKSVMSTDIAENEDSLEFTMDLPGIKKENIKITLEKGILTISASTHSETEEKDQKGKCIRKERHSGEFTRSFSVDKNLTKDDVKAKLEDGVLTLTLPKSVERSSESNIVEIQ